VRSKEASMAIRSALLAALSSVIVIKAHADGFLATPTGSDAAVASASAPAANEVDVGVVTAEAGGAEGPEEESNVGEVEAEAEGDDEADSSLEEVGVTLEAEAAKGGACVDEKGWDKDFANRMYRCAMKTGVNARKAGKCMARKQGVSHACGSCMGKLMKCSVSCASQCCSGKCMQKGKCKRCTARKCNSSFFKCAGVQAP